MFVSLLQAALLAQPELKLDLARQTDASNVLLDMVLQQRKDNQWQPLASSCHKISLNGSVLQLRKILLRDARRCIL